MTSTAEKSEPGGVRAVIIGLGRIASLLEEDPLREKPCTHAGAIAATAGLVLSGGMDRDPERRAAFARRWACPVFSDAAEMLRELRPQVVHIATHPDSHLAYVQLAEKEGAFVAVCEKPLADSLASARKIAAIHRRGRTRVIVNHERRYSANYQAMRQLITGGSFGKILSVKAALYMGQKRGKNPILDVLWHDGTHLIDIASFLTGRTLRFQAVQGARPAGKTGTLFCHGKLTAVKHGGGAVPGQKALPFVLEAGAGRDHLVFEVEVSMERGRIRIGNGVYEVWESADSPYAQGFRALRKTADAFDGPTGYFVNMAADALACARDPGRAPLSSAQDGLAVIEFLAKIA
jgi:predicted dehydrogenase